MTDTAASTTENTATNPFTAFARGFAAMNPFASFGAEAWAKAVSDGVERMKSMQDEAIRYENQGVAQAKVNIDEGARLMHEGLKYAQELGAEWRKLSLEATRRSVEMFTPKR